MCLWGTEGVGEGVGGGGGELRVCGTGSWVRFDPPPPPIKCDLYYICSQLSKSIYSRLDDQFVPKINI